jgi:predicted Zn-dependent peptidase
MACDYTIGQTLMGLESTTNQIMWMGESLLGYSHVLSPEEVENRIHAVTHTCVQQVAHEVRDRGRLNLAVVGPLKDREKIESWL